MSRITPTPTTVGRCMVVVECVCEALLPFYLFVRARIARLNDDPVSSRVPLFLYVYFQTKHFKWSHLKVQCMYYIPYTVKYEQRGRHLFPWQLFSTIEILLYLKQTPSINQKLIQTLSIVRKIWIQYKIILNFVLPTSFSNLINLSKSNILKNCICNSDKIRWCISIINKWQSYHFSQGDIKKVYSITSSHCRKRPTIKHTSVSWDTVWLCVNVSNDCNASSTASHLNLK